MTSPKSNSDLRETNSTPDLVNVADHLEKMAEELPYKRAVIYPAGRDARGRVTYTHLTFSQLNAESHRIAAGLQQIGIGRGIRTILMVKPSLDFFALTFALFKAGAVPVMVDPGMGIGRMLSCLEESRPQAFIGIPKAHILRKLQPRYFKEIKVWVTVGKRLFWGGHTLEQIRRPPADSFRSSRTLRNETAAILFTTGSTGPAKGVVYTHGIFDAQVRLIGSHFNIGQDEIDLPTFPLFALFDPALGMTAVIPEMDPTRPAKVNPVRIIEAIENQGVTNMFASPALLNRVGRYGESQGIRLPSLRRVVSAGAPVAPANIERFASMLCGDAQVHTPYGATEAVPTISIASDEILSETRQLSESGFGTCIGRPLEGLDVRILKITDGPLERYNPDDLMPPGDIGEIMVKGDLVTRHYFHRPKDEALAKVSETPGFWHRMGDLGWQDKKGRFWFCGRKSHRVVTADGTYYSVPCEAIFNNHPQVFRSALVGVGEPPTQIPAICIELEKERDGKSRSDIRKELYEMSRGHEMTRDIDTILFHRSFPVDIRHNSKIFREKLAVWAARKVKLPKAMKP